MPDAEGNTRADSGTDTPLHASKQESGGGLNQPHEDDVEGDPTGSDVLNAPREERGDPDKH